jgi:hypothetical protein
MIVKPGGQHHSSTGLQGGDGDIEVVAQRDGIKIRAQRVVHPGQDHHDIGPRRHRIGQLPVP